MGDKMNKCLINTTINNDSNNQNNNLLVSQN